jgi:hypothetical protein
MTRRLERRVGDLERARQTGVRSRTAEQLREDALAKVATGYADLDDYRTAYADDLDDIRCLFIALVPYAVQARRDAIRYGPFPWSVLAYAPGDEVPDEVRDELVRWPSYLDRLNVEHLARTGRPRRLTDKERESRNFAALAFLVISEDAGLAVRSKIWTQEDGEARLIDPLPVPADAEFRKLIDDARMDWWGSLKNCCDMAEMRRERQAKS